jgi:hypothetical protein
VPKDENFNFFAAALALIEPVLPQARASSPFYDSDNAILSAPLFYDFHKEVWRLKTTALILIFHFSDAVQRHEYFSFQNFFAKLQ